MCLKYITFGFKFQIIFDLYPTTINNSKQEIKIVVNAVCNAYQCNLQKFNIFGIQMLENTKRNINDIPFLVII